MPRRGRCRRSRAGRGAAECSRRGSRAEDFAQALRRRGRAPRGRGAPARPRPPPGVSSQTPARFFAPASVSTSSPPPSNRSRNAGVFGSFSPAPRYRSRPAVIRCTSRTSSPSSVGKQQALAAPLGSREPPALQRRQRRVERLQRRHVRRACLLDRERADGLVQRAPPRLDLGEFRHVGSRPCGADQRSRQAREDRRGRPPGARRRGRATGRSSPRPATRPSPSRCARPRSRSRRCPSPAPATT